MLEWKVSNLKNLFEQSKGEAKSKCVKVRFCLPLLSPGARSLTPISPSPAIATAQQSALFDNHRWQIFLYPVCLLFLLRCPYRLSPARTQADPYLNTRIRATSNTVPSTSRANLP